jgi:hypothetical protein
MKLKDALELEIYSGYGEHISYVYRSLSWNLFPILLCVICGDVVTWIGAIQRLEGPMGEILITWDRRVLEKVEECVAEFTWLACLEMLKMAFRGLL